jgi:hypothetical protein
MIKIAGSCLCGNVKYSCDGEPLAQVVCHCVLCQKQTGTAFSIVAGLPAADLKLTGESHATFVTFGDSGEQTVRHFCSNCGSPIYSESAAMPGLAFLKAGTLDDTSWIKPTANLYCESAQAWVEIDQGMDNYERMMPL